MPPYVDKSIYFDYALDRFSENYPVSGLISDSFQINKNFIAFVNIYEPFSSGAKIFVVPISDADNLPTRSKDLTVRCIAKYAIGGVILADCTVISIFADKLWQSLMRYGQVVDAYDRYLLLCKE